MKTCDQVLALIWLQWTSQTLSQSKPGTFLTHLMVYPLVDLLFVVQHNKRLRGDGTPVENKAEVPALALHVREVYQGSVQSVYAYTYTEETKQGLVWNKRKGSKGAGSTLLMATNKPKRKRDGCHTFALKVGRLCMVMTATGGWFEQTFNVGIPRTRHDSKENNGSACEDQTQTGKSRGQLRQAWHTAECKWTCCDSFFSPLSLPETPG